MFKAITTIPNITDLQIKLVRPRLDTLRINIDDSLRIIPRSSQIISKTYSYNKQMNKTINQKTTRSFNYRRRLKKYPRNKCSIEHSPKFIQRLYFDDRRNFQR